MPRPKNKQELLDLGQVNYKKLLDLINNVDKTTRDKDFPPGTLNRNIPDVLMHLYEWHKMAHHWYEVGMAGEKPAMPAEGYTWKTTPDLNRVIQEKYAGTSILKAKKKIEESHLLIRGIIEQHSDEELFEKKRYKWTGSTSLGAYLISCTSSHYDWAIKLIKKAIK